MFTMMIPISGRFWMPHHSLDIVQIALNLGLSHIRCEPDGTVGEVALKGCPINIPLTFTY